MHILENTNISSRLQNLEPIQGTTADGVVTLSLRQYSPLLCTAIHDGHHMFSWARDNCLLSDKERLQEEDPHTGELLKDMGMVIQARDSRYMYDINRKPLESLYEVAWDRPVWKKPLVASEKKVLLKRHSLYYQYLTEIVERLLGEYEYCLLFDLHTYNGHRQRKGAPLFNIDTYFVDTEMFGDVLACLIEQLDQVCLDGVDCSVACDDVFSGEGYLTEFLYTHYPRCLCISLEVKKVFMDEWTCEVDVQKLADLQSQLSVALSKVGHFFTRKYARCQQQE
ncbi:N-formylglutamate amidohydrolase [Desulfogranum japonicum]|uniref:N-formylglutamate amidohydrolase n=1 Tax=Desulfogranum japonicum TaxID=231447 RepID=UPI00040CAFC5|nr:N-formylglutamate amidohydrolase [Desulfogranum japonicum]